MCNMEKAIKLLHTFLNTTDGQILIIQDSDVDGITSSTIIYDYIQDIDAGRQVCSFIHEGKQHGLKDCINYINDHADKFRMVIAPDSSSNDYEEIEQLLENGIVVIILDHHIVEDLARFEQINQHPLCAIVNNQASPNYNNKALSGAGVAWQFCKAYDEEYFVEYANQYSDLAALGIIGDMMDMTVLENRAIVNVGMRYPTRNYFLKTLIEKQAYSITGETNPSTTKINEKLNPISVAFYIVPLVNALIRVGTIEEKIRLTEAFIDGKKLVPSNKRGEKNKGIMTEAATESIRECTNAKARQDRMKNKVIDALSLQIEKNGLLNDKILLVEVDEDVEEFPNEITGLVAMGLCAKYSRPTLVLRRSTDNFLRGSARGQSAAELTDFRDFLSNTGLFEYVSGHQLAFGCSLPADRKDYFLSQANEQLANVDFNENYYVVDFIYDAADNNIAKTIKDIDSVSHLWGQNNAVPKIAVEHLILCREDISVIGANKNTLRFEVNGITYVKFFATEEIERLDDFSVIEVTVIGEGNMNYWGGRVKPQILITDMEIKDGSYSF